MNRTLFDCGFKKEVELKNGKLYDVTATLPKAVQKQTYDFKCGICPGGYSHTLPIWVCAPQRGHDFEAPDLEWGIHFRGVF